MPTISQNMSEYVFYGHSCIVQEIWWPVQESQSISERLLQMYTITDACTLSMQGEVRCWSL